MAPVTVVDKKVEAKADPTRVDGILLQFQLQKKKRQGKQLKESAQPAGTFIFDAIRKRAESIGRIFGTTRNGRLVGTPPAEAAGALDSCRQ